MKTFYRVRFRADTTVGGKPVTAGTVMELSSTDYEAVRKITELLLVRDIVEEKKSKKEED